jgi:hypothetical protein
MSGAPTDILVTPQGTVTIHTLPASNPAGTTDTVALPFQGVVNGVPIPIISLSSGSITNPTALITRPATAVSSAVTATSANPCVFTWTGNPLVNGQSVLLGGTAVPAGFTAGFPYFVVVSSGNTFQLSATFNGSSIGSSSTGTAVTAALVYAAPNPTLGWGGSLIASSATAPAASSFQMLTSAAIIPRIRVITNATAGWNNAGLSINLWSAPPTYVSGDGTPYAASGSANWLANFQVFLTQFGDGASGGGGITFANEMTIKLGSGTFIFVDIQALSQATPIVSQTFTIIPELLN